MSTWVAPWCSAVWNGSGSDTAARSTSPAAADLQREPRQHRHVGRGLQGALERLLVGDRVVQVDGLAGVDVRGHRVQRHLGLEDVLTTAPG